MEKSSYKLRSLSQVVARTACKKKSKKKKLSITPKPNNPAEQHFVEPQESDSAKNKRTFEEVADRIKQSINTKDQTFTSAASKGILRIVTKQLAQRRNILKFDLAPLEKSMFAPNTTHNEKYKIKQMVDEIRKWNNHIDKNRTNSQFSLKPQKAVQFLYWELQRILQREAFKNSVDKLYLQFLLWFPKHKSDPPETCELRRFHFLRKSHSVHSKLAQARDNAPTIKISDWPSSEVHPIGKNSRNRTRTLSMKQLRMKSESHYHKLVGQIYKELDDKCLKGVQKDFIKARNRIAFNRLKQQTSKPIFAHGSERPVLTLKTRGNSSILPDQPVSTFTPNQVQKQLTDITGISLIKSVTNSIFIQQKQ